MRVDRTRTAPRHAAHRSRQVRGRHSSPQRAQLTSLAPRAERRASRPNSAHARRQRVLSWAERALRGYRFGDVPLVRRRGWHPVRPARSPYRRSARSAARPATVRAIVSECAAADRPQASVRLGSECVAKDVAPQRPHPAATWGPCRKFTPERFASSARAAGRSCKRRR